MAIDLKPHMRAVVERLGLEVTWSPVGGGSRTVLGIFRNRPADILGVQTSGPAIACIEGAETLDLPDGAAQEDDQFLILNTRYQVKKVERDTVKGMVLLPLQLAR